MTNWWQQVMYNVYIKKWTNKKKWTKYLEYMAKLGTKRVGLCNILDFEWSERYLCLETKMQISVLKLKVL